MEGLRSFATGQLEAALSFCHENLSMLRAWQGTKRMCQQDKHCNIMEYIHTYIIIYIPSPLLYDTG
jgi:hypothetical protein